MKTFLVIFVFVITSFLSIGRGCPVSAIWDIFPGVRAEQQFLRVFLKFLPEKSIVFLLTVSVAVVLLLYILNSIALKKIADRLKIPKSHLAWIPMVNQYIMGCIAFYGKKTKTVIYTLVVNLISLFEIIINCIAVFKTENHTVTVLQGISSLLNIVAFIFILNAGHKVYSVLSEKSKVLIALNVFFGLKLFSIFIFFLRNKKFVDDEYLEIGEKSDMCS